MTKEKLVAARIELEEVLDSLHPGYAATNTMLVNAIEGLIREVLTMRRRQKSQEEGSCRVRIVKV